MTKLTPFFTRKPRTRTQRVVINGYEADFEVPARNEEPVVLPWDLFSEVESQEEYDLKMDNARTMTGLAQTTIFFISAVLTGATLLFASENGYPPVLYFVFIGSALFTGFTMTRDFYHKLRRFFLVFF